MATKHTWLLSTWMWRVQVHKCCKCKTQISKTVQKNVKCPINNFYIDYLLKYLFIGLNKIYFKNGFHLCPFTFLNVTKKIKNDMCGSHYISVVWRCFSCSGKTSESYPFLLSSSYTPYPVSATVKIYPESDHFSPPHSHSGLSHHQLLLRFLQQPFDLSPGFCSLISM